MIKRFFPLLFVLAACGSGEKTPFCKCMEAGAEFDAYSSKVIDQVEIDADAAAKMNELKANQNKLCKDYETMGGPEMLELKRACTETNDVE